MGLTQVPRDPFGDVDLRDVDLNAIDESLLQRQEGTSALRRFSITVFLLLVGGTLLWFPSTESYRASPYRDVLFFVVSGTAAILGIVLGKWLWAWAEESAARYAREGLNKPLEPPKPPSTLARWLTLLAALGGGAAVLFGGPAAGYLTGAGGNYTSNWWLSAVGAIVVGSLAGRWLLMHANRPLKEPPKPKKPLVLPPWLKWVNLVALVAFGAFAAFGGDLLANFGGEQTARFSLGGVAFVVGTLGAIWLSRRFDEWEKNLREQGRRRSR